MHLQEIYIPLIPSVHMPFLFCFFNINVPVILTAEVVPPTQFSFLRFCHFFYHMLLSTVTQFLDCSPKNNHYYVLA